MIRERLAAFERAFRGVPHTICYSVKANSNLSILRLLAREGCGFDVVSGGELERVLGGRSPSRKESRLLRRGQIPRGDDGGAEGRNSAVQCGERIGTMGPGGMRGAVAKRRAWLLRVNPDVAAETHPYISTGLHKHKFGVPIGEARALYAKASGARYLKVAGVSVHIGSQITDVAPFAEAMARVAELVRELGRRRAQHRLRRRWRGARNCLPETQPSGVCRVCCGICAGGDRSVARPECASLLEPGRSIVGPAGALLTSVLYRKENDGKRFLVVDAAMNDLIRPALYGAYHEIVPVDSAPGTAAKEGNRRRGRTGMRVGRFLRA